MSVFDHTSHDTSMYRSALTASTGGLPRAVKSKPPLADRQKWYDKRETMNDKGNIKSDERKVHRYPHSPLPSASPLPLSTMRVASRVPVPPSLAAPSPPTATSGPDVFPVSVVARKPGPLAAPLSSAILVRSRPLVGPGSFLVASKMAVQRIFCWYRR